MAIRCPDCGRTIEMEGKDPGSQILCECGRPLTVPSEPAGRRGGRRPGAPGAAEEPTPSEAAAEAPPPGEMRAEEPELIPLAAEPAAAPARAREAIEEEFAPIPLAGQEPEPAAAEAVAEPAPVEIELSAEAPEEAAPEEVAAAVEEAPPPAPAVEEPAVPAFRGVPELDGGPVTGLPLPSKYIQHRLHAPVSSGQGWGTSESREESVEAKPPAPAKKGRRG